MKKEEKQVTKKEKEEPQKPEPENKNEEKKKQQKTESKSWTISSILSFLFKLYVLYLIVSTVREEFFPTKHPVYATPYFSENAKMNVSIDLYHKSTRIKKINEWTQVPYNKKSDFPLKAEIQLTDEIKEKIGEYKVKVVAQMEQPGQKKMKIDGESRLIELRDMAVTRIMKDGDTPKRLEHSDGSKASFRYVRTALFFQISLDFANRYFQNDFFDYKIYEGALLSFSVPGTNNYDHKYIPSVRDDQWWVMPRDLLEETDLFKKFSEQEVLNRKEKSHPNNEKIRIQIDLSTFRNLKWVKKLQMAQAESPFPELNAVYDHIKEILSDNTLGYLILLFTVNFFHTVFMFLSVKENYVFYSKLKRNAGLSFRKAILDLVFEAICLVYYIEYKASFLILMQSVMELVFYFMVVLKMSPLRFDLSRGFPFIFIDRKPLEGIDLETDRHDRFIVKKIFTYMCPILGLYLAYSLYYFDFQTSLYLFIIEKVVAFIFVFGFANMFPQVYINYRLKSVEYLPWKALVYKFFNTIIDDLFAFATKIPLLKRLAVFRDDVIFVIFLVQMYLYRNNEKRGKKEYDELKKASLEQKKVKAD